ncbi:MAG TPA: hypothetical protein VJ063_12035 [Verrucomicrobiae bacterium]|nr:hypothetical protein [Verrucomicrobiae bacterium]
MRWRPIKTARKLPVGTEILVYRPMAPRTSDPAITVALTTKYPTESPQGVKHYTDRWCHPTHWLPIPNPPRNHD